MNGADRAITFNPKLLREATLGQSGADYQPDTAIYSDIPSVRLELDTESDRANVPRVARQLRNLPIGSPLPLDDPDPFGSSLEWAYRCYKVQVEDGQPDQTGAERIFQDYLYLFNVLVALEWQPDEKYLRQLEWTFRRASDLLFDVTNGWMAFGQIVFGGPELMPFADIQIMASNRLLPRSWVSGLHSDTKHMPMRLGRGLWNDRRRDAIAWEEPEGYRTIVHEWGHYALELRDAYLDSRQLVLPEQVPTLGTPGQALVKMPLATVILPRIGLNSESVMATPEGTSELVADQWKTLCERYPRVCSDTGPHEGPYELPLPLPRFRHQKGVAAMDAPAFFPARQQAREIFKHLPPDIQLDRCWIYVLKDISSEHPDTGRLIAQGTLEARSEDVPFRLLGATPGDTVVLIAEHRNDSPVVLRATLGADGTLQQPNIATPTAFPAMDVVPGQTDENGRKAQVSVRLRYAPGAAQQPMPQQALIFPLGQIDAQQVFRLGDPDRAGWMSAPQDVPTLDGHVLLRWADGPLLISSFSQGGGPQTHSPDPANPITAGSSEGNALLFFKNETISDKDYSHIKVGMTMVHGLTGAPAGGRERGYAFSIASNQALPSELTPTLVLYSDPVFLLPDENEAYSGTLRICRLENDEWMPLPTYLPPGYPFVVMPLDKKNGSSLLDDDAPLHIEYYKVCWLAEGS
jgi:hypothetical protein